MPVPSDVVARITRIIDLPAAKVHHSTPSFCSDSLRTCPVVDYKVPHPALASWRTRSESPGTTLRIDNQIAQPSLASPRLWTELPRASLGAGYQISQPSLTSSRLRSELPGTSPVVGTQIPRPEVSLPRIRSESPRIFPVVDDHILHPALTSSRLQSESPITSPVNSQIPCPPLASPRLRSDSPGTSAVVADQVPQPALASSRKRCGQCDDFFCELYCKQCNEFLCRSCVGTLHSRGQMLKHEIIPYETVSFGGEDLAQVGRSFTDAAKLLVDSEEPLPDFSSPIDDQLEFKYPIDSNVNGLDACAREPCMCSIHSLPIECCCLTCDWACVCVICADASHNQHNVVKVQEAMLRLPEAIGNACRELRLRCHERTCTSNYLAQCESQIVTSVSRAREEMRLQFEKLRTDSLEAEQQSLMAVKTMAQDRFDAIFNVSQSEADVLATSESIQSTRDDLVVYLHLFFKLESALAQHPYDEPILKKLRDLKATLRDEIFIPHRKSLSMLQLCESPLELGLTEFQSPANKYEGVFGLPSTKRSLVQEFATLSA